MSTRGLFPTATGRFSSPLLADIVLPSASVYFLLGARGVSSAAPERRPDDTPGACKAGCVSFAKSRPLVASNTVSLIAALAW